MKNYWDSPYFMIPTLLFFVIGLVFAYFVPYGEEILYFNQWRAEPLNTFFHLSTRLGESGAYFIFGIAAFFFGLRYVVLIALTGLLIMPISYTFKHHIGTDRPITYFEKLGMRDEVVVVPSVFLNGGQTSFPSGHTMSAFALFAVLSMMLSVKWEWLGLLASYSAILTAVSRIFLVQHFLMDVLGGAVAGLMVASFVYWVDQKILANMPFLQKRIKL